MLAVVVRKMAVVVEEELSINASNLLAARRNLSPLGSEIRACLDVSAIRFLPRTRAPAPHLALSHVVPSSPWQRRLPGKDGLLLQRRLASTPALAFLFLLYINNNPSTPILIDLARQEHPSLVWNTTSTSDSSPSRFL